jgi:hypothetical protein
MLMPGARSAMWDWWFSWHGCDSLRSKLWHPRGHVHTVWGLGLSQSPVIPTNAWRHAPT